MLPGLPSNIQMRCLMKCYALSAACQSAWILWSCIHKNQTHLRRAQRPPPARSVPSTALSLSQANGCRYEGLLQANMAGPSMTRR